MHSRIYRYVASSRQEGARIAKRFQQEHRRLKDRAEGIANADPFATLEWWKLPIFSKLYSKFSFNVHIRAIQALCSRPKTCQDPRGRLAGRRTLETVFIYCGTAPSPLLFGLTTSWYISTARSSSFQFSKLNSID